MSSSVLNSNYRSFLARTSPRVPVRYHTQLSGASSSSTVEVVRRPHIVLGDIWSSSIGTDDSSGYLYFQYNELVLPHKRHPLTQKIEQLAEEHSGLNSLTSSDLSPDSWFSVAWYPIYPIPSVKGMKKELSAAFLTYHKLKPDFPEIFVEDDKKGKGSGKSSEVVVFPPFGAMTYKAVGNVWKMPGTSDHEDRKKYEEAASSWVEKLSFTHSDYNFFSNCMRYGNPRWWSDATGGYL
ncbi:unnamed protein product [Eruca vesicaria subsp. sativa]|uniref:Uncharacterized protein n=1 Tax=Eruca vesicaria subsp. sativa TaxID=29727 RepID=A0ABC8L144_ERUVS|nr:unnamed protein product [Eruca vesicaria subsp. sativa]